MNFRNKFEDGEKVLIEDEVVTVNQWNYVPSMARYTYTIIENPSTFYFENELTKLES